MDEEGHRASSSLNCTAPQQHREQIHWRFAAVKYNTLDGSISDGDAICSVQFSHDGDLLAMGDRKGYVVVFQRDTRCVKGRKTADFNEYAIFQSHEREFDCLKSLEIVEKINQIKWLKRRCAAQFLLTTTDQTIKLHKMTERDKVLAKGGWNLRRHHDGTLRGGLNGPLKLPRMTSTRSMVVVTPCRVYSHAHDYHINSISVNADEETFISADDLRINLWNLEVTNESFNVVNMKPENMTDLSEVITAAEFHPSVSNCFVHASSKGTIRMCDLRYRSLCDEHVKLFKDQKESANKTMFSDITSSISKVSFSHDGRYFLTRDYMNIKVWDVNMESNPVETFPVHEHLRSRLSELYDDDFVFDKFEASWSGDGRHILTGSYHSLFRTFQRNCTIQTRLYEAAEADRGVYVRQRDVVDGGVRIGMKRTHDNALRPLAQGNINALPIDCTKKLLHTTWHPKEDIVALTTGARLFLFSGF